jgi:hypothetical protein
MILATLVEPSRLSRSARPMFCTISTGEPRVSAKHTLAGDAHAFPEHANAGEEGAVDPASCRLDSVGELARDLAPFGHEVVAAQPR